MGFFRLIVLLSVLFVLKELVLVFLDLELTVSLIMNTMLTIKAIAQKTYRIDINKFMTNDFK